jgi:hypothetical protein
VVTPSWGKSNSSYLPVTLSLGLGSAYGSAIGSPGLGATPYFFLFSLTIAHYLIKSFFSLLINYISRFLLAISVRFFKASESFNYC